MRLVGALFLAVIVVGPASAQRPCDERPEPLAPSRDLYCLELVAVPGVDGVAGRVELNRRPGPFTLTIRADGSEEFSPTAILSGLPSPSSFGAYRMYVAWVLPPLMFPVQRLGEVNNGATVLPPIALDKFVILISAEASSNGNEPQGKVVLRGQSASTRLQPADIMQYMLGAAREEDHAQAHPQQQAASDTLRWTTVPMPAGLAMLPAEMALRPGVAPYLPRGADAPLARPRQVVRLRDGDTLRLEAGIVRRAFKGAGYVMFGFNGQYPGPLIEVAQGANIVIDLVNRLDQPTTVHWHGIRLDNRFDGVPDLTQPPVPPGGRFSYRLRFPDAGIYWYHPHVREDIQQDLGLYGNILVRSPRPDFYGPVHREEALILDDVLIGDAGLVPYGRDVPTHAMMGRFGNVFLVNGEPEFRLAAKQGEVVRLLLTNVANTRMFNLSVPGARMKVVGSDVGNFEREERVESVVIAPAERYVVHARFDSAGRIPLLNRVRAVDQLNGRFFVDIDTLGWVDVEPGTVQPDLLAAFETLRIDSAAVDEISRYRAHFDRPVDRSLVLSIEAPNLPFISRRLMQLDSVFFGSAEWSGTMPMMNWASTGHQVRWIVRDPATGRENMDIDWRFRVGETVKLRLSNERASLHAMQHPIHLHGQRFLILSVNGVPNANLVWKDTFLLPVGSVADILVEMSNPGRWMLHCHIAEHIETGMMMVFTVE